MRGVLPPASLIMLKEKVDILMEIGIQLYSVRNYMHNVDEIKSTLAKVRECGYTCVETAGYAGLDVVTFNNLLKEADLKAVSMHIGLERVNDEDVLPALCEELEVFGATECCVPGMPWEYYRHTKAGYLAFAEILEEAAVELAKKGINLSYHNHCHEFEPASAACGERFIFDSTKQLRMQLDIGHCYAARENPTEWLNRYNDRITTVHYKDTLFDENYKRRDVAICEGEVDWVSATNAIKRSPCKYIIVEHEEFNRDVWDICKTSCDNIKNLLK